MINTVGPVPIAQADEFHLPVPGTMLALSPEFNPPILKGIKIHPDNPFQFDFILDQGDSSKIMSSPNVLVGDLKQESTKLIKYFLAGLTIPEKDLWVNLSPYEKNRIVPESFGKTEMGRDLLAEDYMLKQITASLIYPEGRVGKKFWERIYEEAQKKFGTTNIPVNTFNKVWIIPEKAVVYENAKAGTAYVVESKLKVMLEQDYLSLQKHSIRDSLATPQNDVNALGSQVVRDVIIPQLNREINEGKNFSQLRQVYNSLILATWYKQKIKDSILEQVYGDKKKVAGVNIDDPKETQRIYQRYLQAFKKGVYNYIKDDLDPLTRQPIPRKYFSGGTDLALTATLKTINNFDSTQVGNAALSIVHARINVVRDEAMTIEGVGGDSDHRVNPLKPAVKTDLGRRQPKDNLPKPKKETPPATRPETDFLDLSPEYLKLKRPDDKAALSEDIKVKVEKVNIVANRIWSVVITDGKGHHLLIEVSMTALDALRVNVYDYFISNEHGVKNQNNYQGFIEFEFNDDGSIDGKKSAETLFPHATRDARNPWVRPLAKAWIDQLDGHIFNANQPIFKDALMVIREKPPWFKQGPPIIHNMPTVHHHKVHDKFALIHLQYDEAIKFNFARLILQKIRAVLQEKGYPLIGKMDPEGNEAQHFTPAWVGIYYALAVLVENLDQHEYLVDPSKIYLRVYADEEPYEGIRVEFWGPGPKTVILPDALKTKEWFSVEDKPWPSDKVAPDHARSSRTTRKGQGINNLFDALRHAEDDWKLPKDRHILVGWKEDVEKEGPQPEGHIISLHIPVFPLNDDKAMNVLQPAQLNLKKLVPQKFWGKPIRVVLIADNTGTLTKNFDQPMKARIAKGLVNLLKRRNNYLVVNTGDPLEAIQIAHQAVIKAAQAGKFTDRYFVTWNGGTSSGNLNANGRVKITSQIPDWPEKLRRDLILNLAEVFYDNVIGSFRSDHQFAEGLVSSMPGLTLEKLQKDRQRALDGINKKFNSGTWSQKPDGELKNVATYLLPDFFKQGGFLYDSGAKVALDLFDISNKTPLFDLTFFKKLEQQVREKMAASGSADGFRFFAGDHFLDIVAVSKADAVRDIVQNDVPYSDTEFTLYVVMGDGGNDIPTMQENFGTGENNDLTIPIFLHHEPGFAPDLPSNAFITKQQQTSGAEQVINWLDQIAGKTVNTGIPDLDLLRWGVDTAMNIHDSDLKDLASPKPGERLRKAIIMGHMIDVDPHLGWRRVLDNFNDPAGVEEARIQFEEEQAKIKNEMKEKKLHYEKNEFDELKARRFARAATFYIFRRVDESRNIVHGYIKAEFEKEVENWLASHHLKPSDHDVLYGTSAERNLVKEFKLGHKALKGSGQYGLVENIRLFQLARQMGLDVDFGIKYERDWVYDSIKVLVYRSNLTVEQKNVILMRDRAMNALPNTGGIDLTPANMNLQVKNNSSEAIKFQLDHAMLQQLQNALGFVPVIINIQPMRDLKSFLDSR